MTLIILQVDYSLGMFVDEFMRDEEYTSMEFLRKPRNFI